MSKCVVENCDNLSRHFLPRNQILRDKWLKSLKIDLNITRVRLFSKICSAHFRPEDFINYSPYGISFKRLKTNAIPSILDGSQHQEQVLSTLCSDLSKDLEEEQLLTKPNYNNLRTYSKPVLPFTFVNELPTCTNDNAYVNEPDPLALTCDNNEGAAVCNVDSCLPENNISSLLKTDENGLECAFEVEIESSGTEHMQIFERNSVDKSKYSESVQINISVQTENVYEGFSIHKIKNKPKEIHFCTGLESFEKFKVVFISLGRCVYYLNYFYEIIPNMDPWDQLFMVMIILYRHKTYEELAMLFQTNIKQIYNIFITWIRFMSLQWKNIDLWADKDIVQSSMPYDIYDMYPSTRVILDATECPIKKPKLPLAQQITFSNYKNRNTIKFMIGITPNGMISYVSPSYGGSTSDRLIIERSDILGRFNYGDEIMVDKGINVQDLLVSEGVKVNMPAFFRKGNQIQSTTLTSNRKVASKRVHVERVIRLLKTYKILTQPMNQTETKLSSDIAYVCSMLVNFRNAIVNNNA